MILSGLHEIQQRCGYLPAEELRTLARRLNQPLHRLHEVASFYPLFRLQPPPAVDVKVCRDMACHLHGAAPLTEALRAHGRDLGPAVRVSGVSCLGQCDRPVAVAINDQVYRGLSATEVQARVQAAAAGQPLAPQLADRSPPGWRIDPYDGQPRYEALRRFATHRDADVVLRELEAAGLRGMGGAGFPTARKWAAVRGAADPLRYVICNADESEPGTFKDRELLRRLPYLVLEGLVLAGLVTGAARGIVYIRHEYHDELHALHEALAQAQAAGICGTNVLGTGQDFPIDVFVSPGGYIQGEESALLEALEDRRGEPRNKPPFPVTQGLFGKPTVINNVETLAWVPAILLRGGAWYRQAGVRGAGGLRLVSVSGAVERPGVYEVPFGQTVRELIVDTAGGLRDGQQLKAFAPSGPSGGFLPAVARVEDLPPRFVAQKVPAGATTYDLGDLTLDPASVAALGSLLGGAFVVYGDQADMVEQALNCTQFFRNESCGKCVPCRLGTHRLADMLGQVVAGRTPAADLAQADEVAEAMALTSICGLGQVAANPLRSLVRYFPAELARYQAGSR